MKKFNKLPSFEVVDEQLSYDPETGIITRKTSPCNTVKVGDTFGALDKSNGSIIGSLFRKMWQAHRLAWLLYYGEDPGEMVVDHINRDRTDNRICNLRLASMVENAYNTIKWRGITFHKHNRKWMVRISVDKKRIYLGQFDTEDEARQAYLKAKQELHGEFCPQ